MSTPHMQCYRNGAPVDIVSEPEHLYRQHFQELITQIRAEAAGEDIEIRIFECVPWETENRRRSYLSHRTSTIRYIYPVIFMKIIIDGPVLNNNHHVRDFVMCHRYQQVFHRALADNQEIDTRACDADDHCPVCHDANSDVYYQNDDRSERSRPVETNRQRLLPFMTYCRKPLVNGPVSEVPPERFEAIQSCPLLPTTIAIPVPLARVKEWRKQGITLRDVHDRLCNPGGLRQSYSSFRAAYQHGTLEIGMKKQP